MIRLALPTSNSPSRTVEALCISSILVKLCVFFATEMGQEPGTKECESNTLTIALAGLTLNGC